VIEHGTDRPVVRGGDGITDLARSECPEQRDALRRGERQVVTGAPLQGEPGAEVVTDSRLPGEQVPEFFGVDLAGETERMGGGPDSLTGSLSPAKVVVVDAVRDFVEVVVGPTRGAEPAYRQHSLVEQQVDLDGSMVESSG